MEFANGQREVHTEAFMVSSSVANLGLGQRFKNSATVVSVKSTFLCRDASFPTGLWRLCIQTDVTKLSTHQGDCESRTKTEIFWWTSWWRKRCAERCFAPSSVFLMVVPCTSSLWRLKFHPSKENVTVRWSKPCRTHRLLAFACFAWNFVRVQRKVAFHCRIHHRAQIDMSQFMPCSLWQIRSGYFMKREFTRTSTEVLSIFCWTEWPKHKLQNVVNISGVCSFLFPKRWTALSDPNLCLLKCCIRIFLGAKMWCFLCNICAGSAVSSTSRNVQTPLTAKLPTNISIKVREMSPFGDAKQVRSLTVWTGKNNILCTFQICTFWICWSYQINVWYFYVIFRGIFNILSWRQGIYTHTHTHTHTQRERERERESSTASCSNEKVCLLTTWFEFLLQYLLGSFQLSEWSAPSNIEQMEKNHQNKSNQDGDPWKKLCSNFIQRWMLALLVGTSFVNKCHWRKFKTCLSTRRVLLALSRSHRKQWSRQKRHRRFSGRTTKWASERWRRELTRCLPDSKSFISDKTSLEKVVLHPISL